MPRIAAEKQKCLSRVAYDRIKVMILQKELMPGQFINESQLQETLELGRTPVREAVLALAQDRLVTIHPRKGIEVTRPTPKDIHDIFEIRGIMEPAILRQCCGMVDPQWAVDMRALLQGHADDTASNAGETAAPLIDLDNRFHLELVDVFHNQYASNLMRSLVDFLNLIRVTAWRADRYQISNREHIDILDAILEKDVDRVEVIYAHYKSMGTQIISREQLLPWVPQETKALSDKERNKVYIYEPDCEEILETIYPLVIHSTMYRYLLENQTSEQASRILSMQMANDNAIKLLKNLQLEYNKLRQQNITAELMDIVGGSIE